MWPSLGKAETRVYSANGQFALSWHALLKLSASDRLSSPSVKVRSHHRVARRYSYDKQITNNLCRVFVSGLVTLLTGLDVVG